MNYIHFRQNDLQNEDTLFKKEYLLTNLRGSYSYSTIANCHTRSYHGLYAIPQPQFSADEHIMLSGMDEILEFTDKKYELGSRQYPGKVHPQGHQYLKGFELNKGAKWFYGSEDFELSKEIIFHPKEDRIYIHYLLIRSRGAVKFSLEPFFGFRRKGHMQRESPVHNQPVHIDKGVSFHLRPNYSPLAIQSNSMLSYYHQPLWFYDVEYLRELDRGYDYREDLFSPGFLEKMMREGDELIVTVGTDEVKSIGISRKFESARKPLLELTNMEDCLENAARQFIINREDKTEVIAGFPWFGRWGRDTLIALPGLTLSRKDVRSFENVMKSLLGEMEHGLLPNVGHGDELEFNSVDAPLWIFWAMQEYEKVVGRSKANVWKKWKKEMEKVLDSYRNGTLHNIHMTDDGLIYAGEEGYALTWMDAVINGYAVTPRIGKPVEINALWYNAICYMLELARENKDKQFIKSWEDLPQQIEASFIDTFWSAENGYLADFVRDDHTDWAIRPNQVFALSLPYTIPTAEQAKSILNIVKEKLYTPKGLRTLSQDHPDYTGQYGGTQESRDHAYHQGTVWPWLLGHFAEGWLKVFGKIDGEPFVKDMYQEFEKDMFEHGLGSVSEVYDGDAPHQAGGTISQAWSISELIRIKEMID